MPISYGEGLPFSIPMQSMQPEPGYNYDEYNAKKHDQDKPRIELILKDMPHALLAVAEVLTYGAKKYEASSWKELPDGIDRFLGGLGRHILLEHSEGYHDSESKLLHAAHAACNALFRLELLINKLRE